MKLVKLTFVYDRRGRATRSNPAGVELYVYADGKKKYISTGVRLLPKEWSHGEVSACRDDYEELNEQLRLFKKKASQLVTRMMEDGTLDLNALPSMMTNEMTQTATFIDYIKDVMKMKSKKWASGTRKHYDTLLDFLNEWKGIVYFSDITENKILKMDDVLIGRGIKDNTKWNYHKKMKMLIKYAKNDGLVKSNPYEKLEIDRGEEDGQNRVLTPEEFMQFKNCVIPTESLRKVRDLFVFQTYTMMGYADLERFDYKKCTKMDGQIVYRSNRVKTGKPFTIVLLPPAMEVLKKYKYKLPIISNTKYNLYLKAAVMYAKINKAVSSHYARHTGATLLLNDGNIDIHIISKMLGDTLRETSRTYAKVLDRTIVRSITEYQNSIDPETKTKGQKSKKVLTQKAV